MQENNKENTSPQESLSDKIEAVVKDLQFKAEQVFDKTEDKAQELWEQAGKSDAMKKVKEKIVDIAEDTKGLLDKLIVKLEGEKKEEKKS